VPEARLPFTYVIKGKYWRFRRGELKAALPGKPGDPQFHARYGELVTLSERKAKTPEDTLAALIRLYRKSAEFGALRPPTQLDYGKTLDLIESDDLAQEPFKLITGPMVKQVRDDYAGTPRKAHKIKQMVSRLYSWAQEAQLVAKGHNPAAEFSKLKTRAKSIPVWSEEEITLFLAHCPTHLKTPFLIALCTGQRAEDVVTMDWTAFQGSIVRVTQSKTGEALMIPCHKQLREHLEAVRTRFKGRIARAASGRPYSANGFAKAVADCAAKIPTWPGNRSPHGLRYAAAARLEEVGIGPAIASNIMGHRTYAMAMKYLSARREAEAAMRRVEELS
jgi:integrase